MSGRVWLGAVLAAAFGCAHETAATVTPPAPVASAPAAAAVPAPAARKDAPPAPDQKVDPSKVPGEDVLAKRPEVPPLATFEAPVPVVKTLSNGLKVYIVERAESPVQALRLVVKRGASVDPAEMPGLASMTAELMEAGSAGKSQEQIAAAVDAIGGTLIVGAGQDSTAIGISALKTQLQPMTALFADVALRPNMDAGEYKKLQAQREAELIDDRAHPEVAAELAFRAAIYGEHPLGRPASGTPESVQKMRLTQVKYFFDTFAPEDAALIAVGGAPTDQVMAELEKAFGGWKAGKAKLKPHPAKTPPPDRPRLVEVDFPGKPQSVLRIGHPSVPRSSPDYLALEVLNTILGGSFTSRLNANLREKNGFTYGAFSRFSYGLGPGPFEVATNVKTDVTGPALREAMKEVIGVVDAPLTQEDLEKGKALLAADLVRVLETSDQASSAVSQIFLYDLPLDEYRTFVSRLKALTVADVQAAAKRVLKPAQMTITIAGDVSKVDPQLKNDPTLASLPKAQKRDVSGKLVK